MKYFWNLLGLLTVLILTQCHSQKNTIPTIKKPAKVDYKILGRSTLHGNGAEGIQPGHYIIKDEVAWEKLLAKMDRVNHESQKITSQKIDFDKSMVVAVFDPVLGAGGVSLKVNKIEETDDAILIKIGHQTPSGQLAIQVMNQPYILIELPKTGKKIVVEVEK